MDASQYKDYILVLLFMRYVSDKYGGRTDALIEVPEGGSFQDMVSLKGKAEIGDGINKIIKKLAEANDLEGVIDVADFDDDDKLGKGKDMQDRLSNLVAIFQDEALDFSKNQLHLAHLRFASDPASAEQPRHHPHPNHRAQQHDGRHLHNSRHGARTRRRPTSLRSSPCTSHRGETRSVLFGH
jgi:hypothetical protein